MSVREDMEAVGIRARAASRRLAKVPTARKNAALDGIARSLLDCAPEILAANTEDLATARDTGMSPAMLDRLVLDTARLNAMADALREVAALPDPVGEVTHMWRRPNGMLVGRHRIPLGVILVIYESRPNVTTDAAGLCLKTGNAVILRGGSESIRSNRAIAAVVHRALAEAGLDEDAIQVVATPDREAARALLQLPRYIDVAIPRGGEGLMRFVEEHARVPVLNHAKGVCHVFVDHSARIDKAVSIAYNAKVQRPGVCNAMETLLVHEKVADTFLPAFWEKASSVGVTLFGCESTRRILPEALPATEDDYHAEYLDLRLAVRVVHDLDDAIAHIERYGSSHTEAIVTEDYQNAQRFLSEVGSSCVLVNASTRFNDGNQLGLGAEIGISTSRLHAFGPMGLEELTTQKFIVYGDGQVRL